MKPDKLDRLLAAAAKADPAKPGAAFAGDVLRAIRRDPAPAPAAATFADQLAALLPRIALATALIVVCCVAADLALDSLGRTSLSAGVTELSEQWLFAAK